MRFIRDEISFYSLDVFYRQFFNNPFFRALCLVFCACEGPFFGASLCPGPGGALFGPQFGFDTELNSTRAKSCLIVKAKSKNESQWRSLSCFL